MENAIVVQEEHKYWLEPVASIKQALARYALMHEYATKVLIQGHHYGVVPGTNKPTLLKPGAETLCSLFGLAPTFEAIDSILDVTGRDHDGEPFIYIQYRCTVWSGPNRIAEGIGSCNSFEKKYRYRNADWKCPICGKETIIKSKAEYGGGWLCFAKKGGCGAKFKAGDQSIEGQITSQIKNPDVADLINTLDKMAQKRALVAATLIATNASDYFTQDMEDFADYSNVVDAVVQPAPAPAANGNGNGKPSAIERTVNGLEPHGEAAMDDVNENLQVAMDAPAHGSLQPWEMTADGIPYDSLDKSKLSFHLNGLLAHKGDKVAQYDAEKISYLKKLMGIAK